MKNRHGLQLALAFSIALAGCARAPEGTDTTTTSPTAPSEPSPTRTVQDVMELEDLVPLEPGTYFIDPDTDPSTPLRVVFEVPVEGWLSWLGAVNMTNDHAAVSTTTVTNLVRHGCRDHSPADPPVGSGVDDLATALADLAPFRVTSPPEDVTIYGYRGKQLELTVPNLPVTGEGYTGCVDGNLASWMAPTMGDAGDLPFHGYDDPDRREEFWILDVDGTRLVIEATWAPGSPREVVTEMRAILDSIRIEP